MKNIVNFRNTLFQLMVANGRRISRGGAELVLTAVG
jgi:hypothetical protein